MVENAGHLLTKARLKEKLWSGTYVDDANLTVTIRALRIALGNGHNGTRYIETVPRKGYRFVAPVTKVESAGEAVTGRGREPAEPALETHPISPAPLAEKAEGVRAVVGSKIIHFRRPWLLASGMLVLLLVAAFISGFIRPPSQPVVLKYTQLTYEGHEIGEVLPNDGVRVYFRERVADKQLLGVVAASGNSEPAYLDTPSKTSVLLGIFPRGESLLIGDGLPISTFWKLPLPGGAPQPVEPNLLFRSLRSFAAKTVS